MKFKFIFLIVVFSFLSAQNALSWEAAKSLALKNNYALRMAENELRVANNNATLGMSGWLPNLALNASSNYADQEVPQSGLPVSTTNSAALALSYPIFKGGARIASSKIAANNVEIAKLQSSIQREAVLSQLSSAYYSLNSARENLAIAKEKLQVSRERMVRAKSMESYGQGGSIALLSAQVDLNSDSISVVSARLAMDQQRRVFNQLLNRDLETTVELDSTVKFHRFDSVEKLLEQAFAKNSSFALQKIALQQAKASILATVANSAPEISLTASSSLRQTNKDLDFGFDDPSESVSAGISFSVPLFTGFAQSKRVQNARIEKRNQTLNLNDYKLQLELQVRNAHQNYENALFVLRTLQANLEVAGLNFKRQKEMFELGRITNTQFREAQLNLASAKANISTAKVSAKRAETELLRLTGGLL